MCFYLRTQDILPYGSEGAIGVYTHTYTHTHTHTHTRARTHTHTHLLHARIARPALLVPTDEVDASMPEPGKNEFVVRFFEDCTYSTAGVNDLVLFNAGARPYVFRELLLCYLARAASSVLLHVYVRNTRPCTAPRPHPSHATAIAATCLALLSRSYP